MSRTGVYSELAGSLATVAIAWLGGPVPAVKAALAEVVKFGRGRYDADAAARDLYRNVAEVVEGWAEGEQLPEEKVRLGLALATETVARFGLDRDAIAALNFDPGSVADRVLEAARSADRHWGTEDHYEVAKRGVRQTNGV